MTVTLALPHLFDAVVARFAAEAPVDTVPVPNLFGWRTPEQKEVTGARIAWVPGDPRGQLGPLAAPRSPGGNPRSLALLVEQFHVLINAADTSAPENERKQYQATRELFDAWWRAVYLAAHGTVRVVSAEWVVDHKVRRYGAALRVVCSIDALIPDVAYEAAPADAHAEIDVEELDNTETVTAPEPEEEEP